MSQPMTVSFSMFDTFQTCPLKYKFAYIDRIKKEVEETEFTLFGSAIHDVLNRFYDLPPAPLTLEALHQLWDDSWHTADVQTFFDSHGLLETYEDYHFRGRDILEAFFQRQEQDNQLQQPLMREQMFSTELDEFRLRGRIDRIDKTANGDRVIDYKVSLKGIPPRPVIDRGAQLTFYYLGAQELRGHPPAELALHYVAFDELIITRRDESHVAQLLEDLRLMKDQIERGEFEPRRNALCRFCEYRLDCPLYRYEALSDKEKEFHHDDIDYHMEDIWPALLKAYYLQKKYKNEYESLREIAIEYMRQHDLKAIPHVGTLAQSTYRQVAFEALARAIQETGQIPPIDRQRLSKDLAAFVDDLPDHVKNPILETMTEKTSWILRVSSKRLKEFEDESS